MNRLKQIGFISLVFSTFACQTMKSVDEKVLTNSQRSHFGNCWKSEGSINFIAYKQNKTAFSAMLDWVRRQGVMQWEIYDPLGRTLAAGKIENKKIYTDSALSEVLSKVQIQTDDFMNYDGNNLELKWKELNCLINYQIPEDWLGFKILEDKSSSSAMKMLRFEDHDRSIDVKFEAHQICGNLKTRFIGLFKRERLTWCFRHSSKSFLEFEKTIRLEWNNTEEKEFE